MKKIIIGALALLLLFHIALFGYSAHYQNPGETLSFYEVITTDPTQNGVNPDELSEEQRALYINPALEELLCQCEFQSVSIPQAVQLAAKSEKAEQIGTLLASGKRVARQDRTYIMGRLLFFDEESVYYVVQYAQENLPLIGNGYSITVYRVTPTDELLRQYRTYVKTDEPSKNVLKEALSFIGLSYAQLLREPAVLAPQIALVIAVLALCLYRKKKANDEKERKEYYEEKE